MTESMQEAKNGGINMKKVMAWALALVLILSVSLVSAVAETVPTTETTQTETAPTTETTQIADAGRGRGPGQPGGQPGGQRGGPGGRPDGQRPNGRQPTDGQQAQQPDQRPSDSQQVQQPDQQPTDGQQTQPGQQTRPGMKQGNGQQRKGKMGRGQKAGQAAAQPDAQPDFDAMLKNGVITQETFDAIQKYLQENTEQPAPDAKTTATPAPSAQPGGSAPDSTAQKDLLKDLLDAGAITQEVYDRMAAAQANNSKN